MRSIGVIINPVAGAGRTRLSPDTAARLLRESGFDPEIMVTRLPGGAAELAAQAADRHPLVAIAGGDGTISEAAQGLAGTNTPMVILPVGSGNDFAYGLGIKSPSDGIKALVGGRVKAIDTCAFADRTFVNTCGLFFDGEVSLRAADVSRRWGKFRYAIATAGLVGRYAACPSLWRFTGADGTVREVDGRWILVEVGNGRRCGGGFLLTPEADPADGLLDYCMVREMPWSRFLMTLPRGLNGSHLGAEGVLYRREASATLDVPEPLAVHWDGEADRLPRGTYTFRLFPGNLKVMVPHGMET